MKLRENLGSAAAGAAAGAANGLFGAGGGMVLVPLLTAVTPMEESQIFPASVSIILPVCAVSLVLRAVKTGLPFADAWPYLLGSIAGGILAGKLAGKIPVKWLHRALGLLILWGGVRYLC